VIDYSNMTVANAVLVVEFAMAAILIVGMFVVRRGHVRYHRLIQSAVVLGNVPIVLLWMLPAYLQNVWPGVPGELGDPFYWVPTLMLVLGVLVEAFGTYVILVAGTNLVPERLRFRNYKLWMRTLLLLWWAVLITGLTTYYVWFVGPI
jgi:uncharacterized membrane protein YozB (DUF420 family)